MSIPGSSKWECLPPPPPPRPQLTFSQQQQKQLKYRQTREGFALTEKTKTYIFIKNLQLLTTIEEFSS